MNQEDIQKKQKKVMLYVMMLSLVLVIGVSYAFFTAGMSSETTTTVRADAGTMKITYAGGNNINLSGIYPRDEVWATKTITVTGNNTTEADMYYKLTLVVDSNTFSTSDPLQYELTSTNTSTNGNIIPAISKTNITGSSIELGSGNFVKANNAKHTYQLKIYYPKKTTSQNSNQGATFSAHAEIASVKANVKLGTPNGWYEAGSGTLLAALRDNNVVTEPITIPGEASSANDEEVFASTEDDYGTSYYFRGAVKNNYVQFADKCWRIVRVTGDGSIKLVLHNNNDAGVTNPCGKENNTDQAAFIGVSNFNSYSGNVGYMYGVVDSTDYATKFANVHISNILSDLIDFYPSAYDDLLADVIWCNDKSYTLKSDYNSPQRYGAGDRLLMLHKTSLICPNDNNGGKLSKYTVNDTENGNGNLEYKIGLLTADELAFAGYYAAEYPDNPNTYLKENAIGSWWTMSPSGFVNDISHMIFFAVSLENEESLNESEPGVEFDSSVQIRPSIALVSTVEVTGSGTSEDPYVVE